MDIFSQASLSKPLETPMGGRLGTAAGRQRAGHFARILNNLNKRPSCMFGGLSQPGPAEQAEADCLKSKAAGKEAERLGLSILAESDSATGRGAFRTRRAASLAGLDTSGELLLAKLDLLGPGRSVDIKLADEDLGRLAGIFSESGLDGEDLGQALAGLGDGAVTLERLILAVRRALDGGRDQQRGGLTVRADTLPALGQLLISLGLSPEVARNLQAEITVDQKFESGRLKSWLESFADNGAPFPELTVDELPEARELLVSMGASSRDLKRLERLFNSQEGRLPLDDFLNFLDQAVPGEASLSQKQLQGVETLLAKIMNQQEASKMVEFNKILSLLSAMGDQETGADSEELSPALQALREGISGFGREGDGSGTGAGREHSGRQGERNPERNAFSSGLAARTPAPGPGAGGPAFRETLLNSNAAATIARRIADRIIYSARQGLRRLTLNLNSEHLGPLAVNLKVKGPQISASLIAATPEARQALARELKGLKSRLAEAGLTVEQLTVEALDDGREPPGQTAGNQAWAGAESSAKPAAGAKRPEPGPAGRPSRRPGLISRLV